MSLHSTYYAFNSYIALFICNPGCVLMKASETSPLETGFFNNFVLIERFSYKDVFTLPLILIINL